MGAGSQFGREIVSRLHTAVFEVSSDFRLLPRLWPSARAERSTPAGDPVLASGIGPGLLGIAVALTIAVCKAVLIIHYFMEVPFGRWQFVPAC